MRGPRGYARADVRIRQDVRAALDRHVDLDATQIDVRVSGGEVVLGGSVRDRGAKRLAVEVAADVHGVKDVTNQLRSGNPKRAQPSDAASSAVSSLKVAPARNV
jgi:osmotically-inducible protein OsmY